MKISNINFKGISVTKEQKEINPNRQIRALQKSVLKNWHEQIDLLEDTYKSTKTMGEKWSHNYKDYTWREKKKDSREEVKNTLINHILTCKKSKETVDKMECITTQRLEELEKLDAPIFSIGSSYKIPDGKGIKKIAGYKKELDIIHKEFIDRVAAEKNGQNPDIFGSILFFGPNSNGKTHITKSVAEETGCEIAKIRLKETKNNEGRKEAFEELLEEAKKSQKRFNADRTRTIIFIDEADKLIGKNSPVAGKFEEFIKDCSKKYHCSVFCATNLPQKLAVNMADPDVFPIKMSIDPPNDENMEEILKYYLSNYDTSEIDIKKIVSEVRNKEKTENAKFNVGQIKNICKEAFFIAEEENKEKITEKDLISAINIIGEPILKSDMIKAFEKDYRALIKE